MGIEGGSNNNEVQSQEIQQANIEQQAQNQEAHQRSGEELEANSTIDNEGERKQIEGKDDATEEMDSSSSKLEEKDSIEDDSQNNDVQDAETAQTEQSALDAQDTIVSDAATGVEEPVDAEEQQDDTLETNNEIVDSANEEDVLEDDEDTEESSLDSLDSINDTPEEDIDDDQTETSDLENNSKIEDDNSDNESEAENIDNKPESEEADNKPESENTDNKPESEDTDNKPESEDTDNKAEYEDADNKPEGEDSVDGKPESEDTDNKPESEDTDNKPESEEADNKPESEDTDNKPESEDTDNKPESEEADNKPESEDSVDGKPESEDTDNKPESEDTDNKPESEEADNKPESEDTDNKPESEDTDNKPESEEADNKPESEDTDNKPESEDADNKPESEDSVDGKPESEDTDNKPESEDTDNKPESEDTDNKPESEDADNKPESEDTDNKAESEDADNKPESEDTDNKAESEDADNKPEGEDSVDGKPESEDTDNKPGSEEADNKPEFEDTDNKPETEDADNKPESEEADNKPESEDADNKPEGENTDSKPDGESTDNKPEGDNSDANTDSAESNSDANKKPEKLEDLSWDQINEMLKTPEGKAELMRLNADFRERYEADMWGMSQEDYQDYKAACERYKAEQEAKEKAGNPEHVEPSDAQKKADDVLARFDAMDGKSSRAYMSGAKAQDLKDLSDSNSRYINTDTVKGIVKDVEAVHGIKDKGFGVDVSKKPEEIVLGNSGIKEAKVTDRPDDFEAKDVDRSSVPERTGESREIAQDLKTSLEPFAQSKWDSMSFEERAEAIDKLADSVAKDLGLENRPDVKYYQSDKPGDFGGFSASENAIYINANNMGDAAETADTIAHESRHCWQHEYAEKSDSQQAHEFKENFENYISPDFDYDEYLAQPVEKDARNYANDVCEAIEKTQNTNDGQNISVDEKGFSRNYSDLNPEIGAVFDKPQDLDSKVILSDKLEGDRLEHREHLKEGLIDDAAWAKLNKYADKMGISDLNSYPEKDAKLAEFRSAIENNPRMMGVIEQQTDGLLAQSDERLQENVNAGMKPEKYYEIVNTDKSDRTVDQYKEAIDGTTIEKEFYDDFFKDGSSVAVCYMPKEAFEKFVENIGNIGREDGQFVIPEHVSLDSEKKLEMVGSIENQTDEFKKGMEEALALPGGTFNSGIVRVEIPITRDNLHMPYGIEGGANYQWVPGGRTLGGAREGIVLQISRSNDPALFVDIVSKAKRGD